MKIVVNTRYLLKGKLEGMGWFTYHVLKYWVQNHPEHDFVFVFDRPFDSSFIFAKNVKGVVLAPQARHPILFYIWYEKRIPSLLKKEKADLFVSTDGFSSVGTNVPTLYVLHDIAWKHYPHHIYYTARKFYQYFIPKYCDKAKRIATVSSYSKNDIIDSFSIDKDKIDIVYNGSDDLYKPIGTHEIAQIREKLTDGCPYFIYVGSVNERKNLLRMIKAFDQFRERSNVEIKFVFVGGATGKSKQLNEWIHDCQFSDDIKVLGYVDENKLAKILGAAHAMVYVSLFEGFGIPILEAQHCHVPSIGSSTSSMPEVVGNSGILVDPRSIDQISEAMSRITEDKEMYASLKEACQIDKNRFSWEKTSALMWRCIEKIMDE